MGWIKDFYDRDMHRWVLWVPVFFAWGIGVYFLMDNEPGWSIPLGGIFLGCSGLCLSGRFMRHGAAILFIMGLGFGFAKARVAWIHTPMIDQSYDDLPLEGRLLTIERMPHKLRCVVEVFHSPLTLLQGQKIRLSYPLRDRMTEKRRHLMLGLHPGDRVQLRAALHPPPHRVVPHGYDFRMHAFFAGVSAVGTGHGPIQVIQRSEGLWFESLRYTIGRCLTSILPGQTGAVAMALITGDRSSIDLETRDAFINSGLAHLLAISGLHISLVAGLLFLICQRIVGCIPWPWLSYHGKKIAACLSFGGVLFYMRMAGMGIPAVRATFMTFVLCLAIFLGRFAISVRSLGWAALGVLCLWPESLLTPSFQMSFAAVLALISFYEWSGARWDVVRPPWVLAKRLGVYATQLAMTSCLATLATWPYTAYHFHRFTWHSIESNMVAVPLMGLWIMPWAIVGMLLNPLGWGWIGFTPMGWGIDGIRFVAHVVSSWPGSNVSTGVMPLYVLLMITMGGLWLCLWQQIWRWLGLVPLAIGMVLFWIEPLRPYVFISGQGFPLGMVANDTLYTMGGHAHSFPVRMWMEYAGVKNVQHWRAMHLTYQHDAPGDVKHFSVGDLRFVYAGYKQYIDHLSPHTVVFSCRSHPVLKGEGVLLTKDTAHMCGGYSITWVEGHVAIMTMAHATGRRPWTIIWPDACFNY